MTPLRALMCRSARGLTSQARGKIEVHVSRIGQPDEQHARLLLLQSKEVGVLF